MAPLRREVRHDLRLRRRRSVPAPACDNRPRRPQADGCGVEILTLRYAILSDVHSNLAALRTVIATLTELRPQRWIVAGDLVGYGAYPNECVEVVEELGAICVAGNHDLIALGRLSDERIGTPARVS